MKSEIIKLPFGLNENGALVHVADVESGEKCNCICPGCSSPLIAVKGMMRQHHFRHKDILECKGGLESAIHLAAKQVIKQTKRITLPSYPVNVSAQDSKDVFHKETYVIDGRIVLFDTVDEEKELNGMRADILARKDDVPLIIEIYYRHKVDDDKISKIVKEHISAVEIDLSDLKPDDVKDMESFSSSINDPKRVSWLNNVKANAKFRDLENKLAIVIQKVEKRYRQDEVIKKKREQQDKVRMQIQAENDKPILLKALDELKVLRSANYRNQLTQEAKDHAAWSLIYRKHHISLEELPTFLNVEVPDGDWIFGCDRRIWQASFYYEFVIKRGGGKNYFSIKLVDQWLQHTADCKVHNSAEIVGKLGRRYPHLVPSEVSENMPSSWKTLRTYFNHLDTLGMRKRSANYTFLNS